MIIPPWVSALGILLIACVIGSMIVKSHKEFDGFYDAASKAALAACERSMANCVNPVGKGGRGLPLATCTTEYNTCVAAVTNPSVSTVDPARSIGAGASASSAAGARAQNAIESSGTAGTGASADYTQLATQALAGQTQTLTPGLAAFLRQVQSATPVEYPRPSTQNLDLAQGSGVVPGAATDASGSAYQPHVQRIFPHQQLPYLQPQIVAQVPTDAGTQAEQIASQMITPSLRSQIRDDVQKAVRDEISNIRNNYEVKYVTTE